MAEGAASEDHAGEMMSALLDLDIATDLPPALVDLDAAQPPPPPDVESEEDEIIWEDGSPPATDDEAETDEPTTEASATVDSTTVVEAAETEASEPSDTSGLRFQVGEQVRVNVGTWSPGVVVALHHREIEWPEGKLVPYQIRVEGGELAGQYCYAPEDSNTFIRPRVPVEGEGDEEARAEGEEEEEEDEEEEEEEDGDDDEEEQEEGLDENGEVVIDQQLLNGIARLEKEAKHGNAASQALLGESYIYGQGVPEDHKRAVRGWALHSDGVFVRPFVAFLFVFDLPERKITNQPFRSSCSSAVRARGMLQGSGYWPSATCSAGASTAISRRPGGFSSNPDAKPELFRFVPCPQNPTLFVALPRSAGLQTGVRSRRH